MALAKLFVCTVDLQAVRDLAETDGQDSHFLPKIGKTTPDFESCKLTYFIVTKSSEKNLYKSLR